MRDEEKAGSVEEVILEEGKERQDEWLLGPLGTSFIMAKCCRRACKYKCVFREHDGVSAEGKHGSRGGGNMTTNRTNIDSVARITANSFEVKAN